SPENQFESILTPFIQPKSGSHDIFDNRRYGKLWLAHHHRSVPKTAVRHHLCQHNAELTIILARGSDDHRSGLEPLRRTKLVGNSFDVVVSSRNLVFTHQVLPAGHRIPTAIQSLLDDPAVRLPCAG